MRVDRTRALGPPDRIFPGYAFDLDGTIYLSDVPRPGAIDSLARLRRLGCRIMFATNKPLASAATYARKLNRLGVSCREDDVVTATDALVDYLGARYPGRRVLLIAESAVRRALARAGYTLTDDPSKTDVVVVSFDRTFDYAKLTAAYRAVRIHGAALIATNPDPYCPTADGGLPDCAAMLAAIEACTGQPAEAITGKPDRSMGLAVLRRMGLPAHAVAMVGDRLATDIGLAAAAGMTGVLVLGGATRREDIATGGPQPHHVIDSLTDLFPGGVTRISSREP